jgi:hypothetical protein
LRSEGIESIVPLHSKAEIAGGLLRFISAARDHNQLTRSVERYSRKARTQELAQLLNSVCQRDFSTATAASERVDGFAKKETFG